MTLDQRLPRVTARLRGEAEPTLTGSRPRGIFTILDFSARAVMTAGRLHRRTRMKITREQVDYVALLGRLALEPEEKEKYMGQLDDILKYMDMLAEVPTDDVEPMAGPV